MPYAANGQISQSPIEGGIEITQQQYEQALAGMLEGKIVSVDGGFAIIDPPQEAAPEPSPPESQTDLSFADKQAVKILEINTAFERAASALTAGYPEAERLTWPVQQAEALAWEADNNAPTPYLDGLAVARGISAEEMRSKTLAQTQLFMAASQQLVGKRQKLRDLVHEAETPEDLEDIQWDEPAA